VQAVGIAICSIYTEEDILMTTMKTMKSPRTLVLTGMLALIAVWITGGNGRVGMRVSASEAATVLGGCGDYEDLANGACTTVVANNCKNQSVPCPSDACGYKCTPVTTLVDGSTYINYNYNTVTCATVATAGGCITAGSGCSCLGFPVQGVCNASQLTLGSQCSG
jgi:hypothetical protein